MICGGCGEKNRDGARFCLFCGTALAARCSVCDNELPSGARFCDSCGTPVDAGREPAAAARKVVTVLFVDLTGSTALEEKLDAESVRSILDRFNATLRTETERFGGHVVKFTGDGLMAVFGIPDVREDDASRAVDAALAMQAECAHLSGDLGLELAIKVGVNTGEVVVSETDEDVVGDCVNVAARLEGAATSGEVLVGEETWRLTRATSRYETIAPLRLKGKSEPVPAYRLLAVDERTADSAAAPFVGRERELGRLLAAFQEAVDANGAKLVTVIGAPGLGKTRLSRELMSELEGQARVRETRCDPADSSTFAPIADALRGAAGLTEAADEQEVVEALAALIPSDDPDRDRIATRAAAILGAGTAGSTEETFWALRRIIETAAQADPVVLVIDDIHWAEPLLLDLIEHLAEWIRGAPVLIVGTARPELRDIRPSLTEGGRLATVVALEGLDQSSTARLALNLLGTEELPQELLTKIPASTEGNPLFVRELVRMLVDDGVLLRTGGGWTVTLDVDAIQVPPTIHALLAARVDRLRNDERTFIELAAVVGKEFYRGALYELAPAPIRDQLDGCLESLRRKELVEPAGTYWIDEPVYRFHHVLIRDAAYRRLLKEARAELHERVADWLGAKTQDVLGEHDELIGYHLEQAHEYKAQLGRDDDELGGRASRLLGSAANRSLDRDDLPAAASLSGRALARLPHEDPSRAEFLLVRCEALLSIGDVAAGADAVAELERVADTPRLSAWARCFAGQLANLTSPELLEETEKHVAAAAAQLAELGDPAGAAKGHTVHAATLARLGRFAECERVLDGGLTAARAANDRRRITAVLGSAPHAALWGPSPVSRAGGRCLDIVRLLRITTGSPAVEATSLRCQAVLEAFRGRADAARRMLSSARRTLTELGLQHELLEAEQFAGIVELVAGDPSAAIVHLSTAFEGFRSVGVEVLAAQSAALLARAHLQLDELDDATRFAEESELLGGQDLKASIAWRAVRAELLARRGQFDEAKHLAEAAVEIASRTDALIDHADACRALAAVCRLAGDAVAARSASDRAASLYERKGATSLLESPVLPAPVHAPALAPNEVGNAAFRRAQELARLITARDWDGVARHLAADVSVEDRRTVIGVDVVNDREGYLRQAQTIIDIGVDRIVSELVAERGERLAMIRCWYVGGEDEASLLEVELIQTFEYGEDGLLARTVLFDAGALDAAIAFLEERFIAGEGAAYERTIRSVAETTESINARAWIVRPTTPGFRFIDHRPASLGAFDDLARVIEAQRSLVELIPDLLTRITRYVALARSGTVAEVRAGGTNAQGEAVDLSFLALIEYDGEALARLEYFPPYALDAALGAFAGAEQGASISDPRENACSRSVHRAMERMNAGDLDTMREMSRPDVVFEDRRPVLRSELDGIDAGLANLTLALGGRPQIATQTIATREERSAIISTVWSGSRPTDYVVEIVNVFEVDEQGLISTVIQFDATDIDAAFAELDERYVASSDARIEVTLGVKLVHLLNARDWDAIRALAAPGCAVVDHTPASRGQMDIDGYITSLQGLVSLAPDLRTRLIEVRAIADGMSLGRAWNAGTSGDGVEFEISYHVLGVMEDDKFARMELFPVQEFDAARDRFDELASAGAAPAGLPPNDAARAMARRIDDFLAGDLDSYIDQLAPDVRFEDRRHGLQAGFDGRDIALEVLDGIRSIGVDSAGASLLATRGARLALHRVVISGTRYESDLLNLDELNDAGKIEALIAFDSDDLDAAFAELDRRYIAGEGAGQTSFHVLAEVLEAHRLRDWARARRTIADDFVLIDHRPAGLGRQDADEYIRGVAGLTEVIPDLRIRCVAIHAVLPDRGVFEIHASGTNTADGAIDLRFLMVAAMRDGLGNHAEYFPVEQLDAALQRFEDLGTRRSTRGNDAVRAYLDAYAAASRGDEDWATRYFEPGVVLDDRRRGLQWEFSGRPLFEHARSVAASSEETTTVVAVRGRRLALIRQLTRSPEGWEVEAITVIGLGSDGRIAHVVSFDPDDLDAAFNALDELFVLGEGARFADLIRFGNGIFKALRAGDVSVLRDALAHDVVFVDHRPASAGEMTGGSEYMRYFGAFADVMPSVREDVVAIHTVDAYGGVWESLARGVNDEDGEVEIAMIYAAIISGGVVKRIEIFPSERLDEALARFDELVRAEASTPRRNACTESWDRAQELYATRDWEGYGDIISTTIRFEDRRAGLGSVVEGVDGFREQMKVIASMGAVPTSVIVATRDDDAAVLRVRWSDPTGASAVEVEAVHVHRLGPDGKIASVVVFDADGLDAALAELDRPPTSGNRCCEVVDALFSAFVASDWDRIRALSSPEIVVEDRRMGMHNRFVGVEGFVAASQAIADVATITTGYDFLATRGDRLSLSRHTFFAGDTDDVFEVAALLLHEVDDDGLCVTQIAFDPDDLDAGFEELDRRYLAGEGAPFAALLRNASAQREALIRGDFEAYRELMAPDVVLVDHRPTSLGIIEGIEDVLAAVRGFSPLVRKVVIRVVAYHAIDVDRSLVEMLATAEAEHGGTIEVANLRLQSVRDGRVHRIELFETDDLTKALARFDALAPGAGAGPLSNRAVEVVGEVFSPSSAAAHHPEDWFARDIAFIDRRPGVRSEAHGLDEFLRTAAAVVSVGLRATSFEPIAVRGERLTLVRQTWMTDTGFGDAVLNVFEIDDEGKIVRWVGFDSDAADDAFAELDERWARSGGAPAAVMIRLGSRLLRAIHAKDWETLLGTMAPNVWYEDHRPLGPAVMREREAFIGSIKALSDLIPDLRYDLVREIAFGEHVALAEYRAGGTNLEGGAVEYAYLQVVTERDGVVTSVDRYDLDQADEARARYEALAGI